MKLFNLKEWILEHFKVRVHNYFNNIYFKYSVSVPSEIYVFDTCQPSGYFYRDIICKIQENFNIPQMSNLVLTLKQLISEKNLWEQLYYKVGKNFLFFLLKKCEVYFKWGENTYILLTNFENYLNPKKSVILKYESSSLSSVYTAGFDKDVPIKIYRVLYSTNRKKNSMHVVSKNLFDLKKEILSQNVGPEVFMLNSFGTKQIKSLKTLIKCNLTLNDCKLMLNEIVHEQENIIPTQKVIVLLSKTIEMFVPYKLLFKRKYLKKFIKNLQCLLKFSLKQKITLGFVMNGIAENMDPLKINTVAKVIMWLINKFIVKIIRSLFYVTVADKGNSLIFIKQKFWSKFQKMAVRQMIGDNRLLQVSDTIHPEKLKNFKVFPKLNGSGFRPVITSSKCNEDNLELCKVFLKQLINSRRGNPNPSEELHYSWLNYTNTKNKALQYYYIKTDIKDAYGSIIHDKLKNILEKWFDVLKNNLIVISFQFKGKWGKLDVLQQFIDLPSSCGKKILIFKQDKEKIVTLYQLKSQIFDYIDNIYFLFSRKKYRMIKGLPQGGKLSAALCEIYYTSFDQDYLSSLSNIKNGEILLRAVDDYLFISHNKNKIHKFLRIMSSGFPEYGLEIQNDKTVSNCDFIGTKVDCDSYINFFGYNLDIKRCFITSNLHNYNYVNVRSSITFNDLNKGILLQKMRSAISLKLQPLLFDHTYQSLRTIIFNIHCASCVMALKYVAVVHFLKLAKVQLDKKFLLKCIEKATHSIASNIQRKAFITRDVTFEYNAAKKVCIQSFILILKLKRKMYYFNISRILALKARRLDIKSKRIKRIIKSVGKVIPPDLSIS